MTKNAFRSLNQDRPPTGTVDAYRRFESVSHSPSVSWQPLRLRILLNLVLLNLALCAAAVGCGAALANAEESRPNVLWITAEDMSPTLGCYGDDYATTPNLDAFAETAVRYTHAFATAPVCSPSRSCLIQGCPATSLGTHNMRSRMPLPTEMTGFPALLRKAGYYTTNNVKTDYNTSHEQAIIDASWDASSDKADWRGRKPGQPFFSVINLMTSHQSRSMVWSYDQFEREVQSQLEPSRRHDPAAIDVPPYYPDTPAIRRTLARYYDCVAVMDQQVGQILKQLDADGLADDTIVFFYSDHGSGLPRHKRALLDTGTRVPLMIRFPEKFQRFSPKPPGGVSDRLVAFEDFGPTVLDLAGLGNLPKTMRGRAFLGPRSQEPRQYVYGHRDRIDEAVDMARSVRDGRFLYIRNYMPHIGYNQPSAWADDGEIRGEIYRLSDPQTMTPAQWHYAGPRRPIEELYDCQADPLNLRNLADSPEHRDELKRLRKAHRQWVITSRDLGFLPETELSQVATVTPPFAWAQEENHYQIEPILAAASLVGTDSFSAFGRMLQNERAAIRYWGAVGCSAAAKLPDDLFPPLAAALTDPRPSVQTEAAGALTRHGRGNVALPVLARLLNADDETTVLHAARTVEMLGPLASRLHGDVQALAERFRDRPGDLAWFVRFTTSGYLKRTKPLAKDQLSSVDTSGPIPSDAVVIFAGKSTAMLAGPNGGPCRWPVENGALVCDPQGQQRQQGLWTRLHFRDAQIHVEFQIPAGASAGGGNSGLYVHGLFEQQILNSYGSGVPPSQASGALYGFSPPLVNAARKPAEWQTYDVVFRAPRRDAEGEPTQPGSVTTFLNQVLVQAGTSFSRPKSKYAPLHFRATDYATKIRESLMQTECGPLQLQDHDSPLRFRAIWIRPLDDRAFVFSPGDGKPNGKNGGR